MAEDGEVLLAALQAALAGTHAAVWASGRAAAELAGSRRERALRELDLHRRDRDALRLRVLAAEGRPVDAAPAYVEPFPVTGARTARRLLAHVNAGLVAVWADLAAAHDPGMRSADVDAATRAAIRAVEWGAQPSAFPGAPVSG